MVSFCFCLFLIFRSVSWADCRVSIWAGLVIDPQAPLQGGGQLPCSSNNGCVPPVSSFCSSCELGPCEQTRSKKNKLSLFQGRGRGQGSGMEMVHLDLQVTVFCLQHQPQTCSFPEAASHPPKPGDHWFCSRTHFCLFVCLLSAFSPAAC